MLGGLGDEVQIEARVVLGSGQCGHQRLGGRLAGAVAQGRQRAVHDVHARLNGLQIGHVANAGGVVGVQMDLRLRLQGLL